MKALTESSRRPATPVRPRPAEQDAVPVASVPLWRLYLLRAGYVFVAGGIFATQWPTLISHHPAWPLFQGVTSSLLAAVSVLALLGIRYPLQMLPVLLFEVTWKVIWGAAVAWPLWAADGLDQATRQVLSECLWVVVVVAVLPWRYLVAEYVRQPGDRWR